MASNNSSLDLHLDAIRRWLYAFKTNEEIARLLADKGVKTTESSVRRCIDRNRDLLGEAAELRTARNTLEQEADAPGFSFDGDDEVIVTEPVTEIPDGKTFEDVARLTIQSVMERHQLDSEVWDCERVMPNVWQGQRKGGEIVNFYQFKLFFKRKVPIAALLPATEPLKRSYKTRPVDNGGAVVTVIETDPQHPFIIPELNELAIQFIHWLQPDRHVVGGDLMNLGYIGRHRDNPKWDDTVNEAKQSAFEWLYHRRNASEDMEMWLIPGNHDDRIRNEQLERNERLYGVTQAHYPDEEEGPRVYSLSHLLRFPELEVNYHEPDGTYEFEFVEITPLLAVRHGHKLSKGATMRTANELGHSVVLGHSHRQSAMAETIWNKITNDWHVRWAVEAGCECQHLEGLGFNRAGAPDWQPGFVTVHSWPSGEFTFDFASFTPNGELLWRDKRFTI